MPAYTTSDPMATILPNAIRASGKISRGRMKVFVPHEARVYREAFEGEDHIFISKEEEACVNAFIVRLARLSHASLLRLFVLIGFFLSHLSSSR